MGFSCIIFKYFLVSLSYRTTSLFWQNRRVCFDFIFCCGFVVSIGRGQKRFYTLLEVNGLEDMEKSLYRSKISPRAVKNIS